MNSGKDDSENLVTETNLNAAGNVAPEKPEAGTAEETSTTSAPESVTAPDPSEIDEWNRQVRRRMRQQTRRSFLLWGAALAAGAGAFEWLTTRNKMGDVPWPIRKTLELNERLARGFYTDHRLSRTYNASQVSPDRLNGDVGLDEEIDLAAWKLRVEGIASGTSPLMLGLDAIRKLPRVEMTTELKCIEGWSIIVNWVGARFSDFVAAYRPQFTKYVGIVTPDEGYYVGWDMPSILHPQTLLAYEMNGAPLAMEHGAPLRLVSTVKYGIKMIKRIGRIEFTNERPPDFWAEQGYDWYSGH